MDQARMQRPWASFHGGHTAFGDGQGTVGEVAQSAANRGFLAFGFSEHFTTPPIREFSPAAVERQRDRPTEWLAGYVAAVQAAQHAHEGQLTILLGTELEYIRGAEGWTREQLRPWPFEYFVGSVHYVRYDDEDICIDWDRAHTGEALRRAGSPERLCLDYYDHVLELLDWRIAHVIGHVDLIKIFLGPNERAETQAIRLKVNGVLETMRDRGVALDINARGLIKPCRQIYPSDWIMADAFRTGVQVMLGDDSHSPEEVGARLDQAVIALRRAGFTEMTIVDRDGSLQSVRLPD